MSEPTTPDPDNTATTELTAFTMAAVFSDSGTEEARKWRASSALRKEWRDVSRKLVQGLEAAGLSITVRSRRKLQDALTELITVPASVAYDPSEEDVESTTAKNE